jgi:hypothetical protein
MKYIRTKTFITDLANWMEVDGKTLIIGGAKHEIIAQADNIEDLFDEFVWVTPEGEHRIKPKTGDGLWYLCCDYKKGHQIYGAIWTDKGLIYIAKLTDEGWELV